MAATFFKGSFLLTPEGLKKDWGLKVEGNRIAWVGPNDRIQAGAEDEVIDASGHVIAPGFVNGHNHMYNLIARGITTSALVTDFSNFLEDFWWPYVENRVDHEIARVTTAWSCVEMLNSGITSFTDILEGPNAIPGALEVEAEVVRKAGLRAFLTFEACQRMSEENAQLGLKENYDFVRNNNKPGNLVQGMMSVHTLFTGTKEFMKQAKSMARELDCDIHMHMSESIFEPTWTKEKYGKYPVDVYDEIGFLDDKVFVSQCVQMQDHEIDIMAERGVRAITMPLSNCEVGGGVAPVYKMLDKGVKVAMGTDGFNNNMFAVMRGLWCIPKAYLQDTQVMPAKTVYKIATEWGAEAMGIPDAGKLQEGCLADIITINADTSTPLNENNVYDQLVLYRDSRDVNHVMVDGKLLKRDGRLLTLDEESIHAEAYEVVSKVWSGK